MREFWTPEEISKLTELAGTLSFPEMVRLHFPTRTAQSLQRKSTKLKLKSGYRAKLYSHNPDFWKTINLVTAYYAGIIAADGNLHKVRNYLTWSISSKDLCLLEDFKIRTEFTGNIVTYSRKKYQSEGEKSVSTLAVASCAEWYKDLAEIWNITTAKTFSLMPPTITDKELVLSYIAGFIDGDGWVTGRANRNTVRVGVVNASLPLLEWIKQNLDNYFPLVPIPHKVIPKLSEIKKHSTGNYYEYFIDGIRAATVFDYLSKLPVPKLARKWENPAVLEIVAGYKQKYPQHFLSV